MQTAGVALITGAGKPHGIGAAVAKLLAAKGFDIIINCIHSAEEAGILVNTLSSDYNIFSQAIIGDAAEQRVCENMKEIIAKRWGKLDILVNCIGATKLASYQNLDLLEKEDFDKILTANITVPFLVTKAVKQLLLKAKSPNLINISSAAGITGKGSSIAYAAAKGGENTLTLALSQALSPQVRVNAICPSFVDSSWWDKYSDRSSDSYSRMLEGIKNNNLHAKVLSPDDVAKTVEFIIETPISGEIIRLDHGAHIGKAQINKQ